MQVPEGPGGDVEGLDLIEAGLPGVDKEEAKAAAGIYKEEGKRSGQRESDKWGPPRFITGDQPVNDFERQMFRSFVPNLDQLIRIFANRNMNSNNVDFLITNFGWRRWLKVKLPPNIMAMIDEHDRKFSTIGVKPITELTLSELLQIHRGEIRATFRGKKSHTLQLYVPDGYEPIETINVVRLERPYDFWVLDSDRAERATRMFNGFFGLPSPEVAKEYKRLLGPDLMTKISNYETATAGMNHQQRMRQISNHLSDNEQHQIHDLYWEAQSNIWKLHMEFKTVVETFQKQYLPLYPENNYRDRGKFYRPVVYTHRFDYWSAVESGLGVKESLSRPQNIFESIDAYEAMANMMSAVIKPLPVDGKGVIQRGLEEVWYNSAYDGHHLRKTVDSIKQKQMLERAIANLLLTDATVKGAPDKWLPGSWEAVRVGDLYLPGIPPELYLGDLASLDPDYVIQPGPFLAAEYLKSVNRLGNSFKSLIDYFDFLRGLQLTDQGNFRTRNGDILSIDDLISKWAAGKSLVQKKPEEVVWTWWNEESRQMYWEPGDGRVPHAVTRGPKLLWMDFPFTMGEFHMVRDRVAQYANDKAQEAGLSVRITYDGPESNYFRHHDILWEAYQEKLAPWIIYRLREVWNREVEKNNIEHIRPVYYKEILSLIPREFLRHVSLPREEVPDSDWIARLIQWFNRQSDYRVRLYSGMSSHGSGGNLMGFKINKAVGYWEDGYGTDNGLSWKDQDARGEDLIYFGWQNEHFNGALYLARSMSLGIDTSTSGLSRLDEYKSAVRSARVHPDIAYHVAEGFKGIDKKLFPLTEHAAIKHVKKIFELKEIKQIGREEVKKIIEEKQFRRTMREMVVA